MQHYTINLQHAANAGDVTAAIALATPETHEQPRTEQTHSGLVILSSRGAAVTCVGLTEPKQTLILTYSNQRIVSMSYAYNAEVEGC